MDLKGRHFLTLKDFTPEEIIYLLDLAAELGVSDIIGTPTVLVLGRDGALLNGNTAKGWRNAASRSEDAVFAELESFTRN